MKKNEHFSESAKLYAANIEIVEQMKKVYEEDLKAFVDKVVERIRALILPARLCRRTFQPLEWLWIGEDEVKEWGQGGSSLSLSLRQPEIIRGGRLDVTVWSDADTQQLDRVVAHPGFPPSFNRNNKSVDVPIDLRSGDGVEVAAALLVKMLQAIDASYPARSKQFSKPRSR
jgi:hypothetical protein